MFPVATDGGGDGGAVSKACGQKGHCGLARVRQWGEVSVNRTSIV